MSGPEVCFSRMKSLRQNLFGKPVTNIIHGSTLILHV